MNVPVPILDNPLLVEFIESSLSAGFPSPAADHAQRRIDLTAQLILNPESTFMFRINGDSMKNVGIYHGDVVLVDRSIPAQSENVVVAEVDAEFTCKRFRRDGDRYLLVPENDDFEVIELEEGQVLSIWGTVTVSLRFHFTAFQRKHERAHQKHSAGRCQ